MALKGTFRDMALPDLLQMLGQGRRTGLLVVRNQLGITKRVWIIEGEVYATASSDPREYLGHFLISHGLINERQLEMGMATQEKTGIKLGQILVSIGAVDQATLDRLLLMKIHETVFSLFLWPDAGFEFIDDEKIAGGIEQPRVDMTFLLMEGTRRADEYQRIAQALPAGLTTVLELAGLYPGPDLLEDHPIASVMFERLDGARNLNSIMLDIHALEYETLTAALALVDAGVARIVSVRETADVDWQRKVQAQIFTKAKSQFEAGDYTGAANLCQYLIQNGLFIDEARTMQRVCEEKTRVDFDAEVPLDAIPVLKVPLAQLAGQALSAQEGFLCSRMDGNYSIRSILKITPIPEPEARRAIYNLKMKGVLALKPGK